MLANATKVTTVQAPILDGTTTEPRPGSHSVFPHLVGAKPSARRPKARPPNVQAVGLAYEVGPIRACPVELLPVGNMQPVGTTARVAYRAASVLSSYAGASWSAGEFSSGADDGRYYKVSRPGTTAVSRHVVPRPQDGRTHACVRSISDEVGIGNRVASSPNHLGSVGIADRRRHRCRPLRGPKSQEQDLSFGSARAIRAYTSLPADWLTHRRAHH